MEKGRKKEKEESGKIKDLASDLASDKKDLEESGKTVTI